MRFVPTPAIVCLFCGAMLASQDARAQSARKPSSANSAQTTVVQIENVRTEYAQVLRAEPVYQTLRATSIVESCNRSPVVEPSATPRTGLSKITGAVKDAFARSTEQPETEANPDAECEMVPVQREFRRPIAYDVDYVHKGVKYRSRMPYDPGNRMRIRVSVTPIVSANQK